MIKQLIKLADHLDSKGLRKEADILDNIARKIAATDLPSGQGTLLEYPDYQESSYDELGVSKKVEHDAGSRDISSMPDDGAEGKVLLMLEDGQLTPEDLERLAEIMRRSQDEQEGV